MHKEVVHGRGHPNVTGTHRSTFEITRDEEISKSADCIIVVGADKGAASLSDGFKKAAAHDDAFITCVIEAGGFRDVVTGWGSEKMTFSVEDSMVFRVSDYVCGRTVMIRADKPAARLDRRLIAALAEGNKAILELSVEQKDRPEPSLDALFKEV
ncbi:Uncharacterized protein conserved in archaea [Methanocella conradii HZ254]|uniref:Uncharacterized protein conserved in archaea n=1 Tax=Methanocella conradii (strain DSM 24694 / JCM 17849 / CGMCC 1.5162 / HZ254) TaxID=1041930 RepID=H8I696_METCZ|nr:DUF371 domain-containing protein [Methanocella conradii]AFD00743.1 Uncharacterized protein conserved in archaea [Methanocella conradii HZ254]